MESSSRLHLHYDTKWKPGSVYLRINLSRRLGTDELMDLLGVVEATAFATTPVDPGASQESADHLQQYYTGDLGKWVQFCVDLGGAADIAVRFAVIVSRLFGRDYAESVTLGSDVDDWPHAPAPRDRHAG